ncbi:radical SAM protein, partial [candidate division WOR-3 bacterium]|nr:radical SAM protein [candidate division WOR-3 bacterium]
VTSLYEPRGAARIYADLAVNIYDRCPHGCRYCYCPRILHISEFEYYSPHPQPRPGLLDDLMRACHEWAAVSDERPYVHVSFLGDPLPRSVKPGITEAVINLLHRFQFPVQLLSKSGYLPDSTLSELSERDRYWISLTTLDPERCRFFEPFAGTAEERLAALARARAAGVKVGVSLEPVLSHEDAAQVLAALPKLKPELVWVGMLNHRATPYKWGDVKQQLAKLASELGLPVRFKDDVHVRPD